MGNASEIKVRVREGFTVYNHDQTEVLAKVEMGDVYTAHLHTSGEYFARDKQGREFYVGEINFEGELVLDEGLELLKGDG